MFPTKFAETPGRFGKQRDGSAVSFLCPPNGNMGTVLTFPVLTPSNLLGSKEMVLDRSPDERNEIKIIYYM